MSKHTPIAVEAVTTEQLPVPTPASWINASQRAILLTHSNGEFAHLLECANQQDFRQQLDECADGLLKFLVIETADAEDCDSPDEAIRRLDTAISEIAAAQHALYAVAGVAADTAANA